MDGRITGCYLHGLFSADSFRKAFLEKLGKPITGHNYASSVEDTLDALSVHLETHMDLDRLLGLAKKV